MDRDKEDSSRYTVDKDDIVMKNKYEGLEKERYRVVEEELEIKMVDMEKCK